MQKMIRSPAGPGTIGPLWCLHLVAAIYARLRIKATFAAAAARAGLKMSKKSNTESTEMTRPHLILKRYNMKKSSYNKFSHEGL